VVLGGSESCWNTPNWPHTGLPLDEIEGLYHFMYCGKMPVTNERQILKYGRGWQSPKSVHEKIHNAAKIVAEVMRDVIDKPMLLFQHERNEVKSPMEQPDAMVREGHLKAGAVAKMKDKTGESYVAQDRTRRAYPSSIFSSATELAI
jgi:hypothetical protein